MTQPPTLPSNPNNLNSMPPKQALLTMRIIWAALLLGQLMFMGVVALQLSPNHQPAAEPQPMLAVVNLIMLLTIVPLMFLIRRTIQQRARTPDGIVPMSAYSTGNIIFWAGCEGVSFFGLVVALLNRSFWPTILIVAVAMLAQVITFPKAAAIKKTDDTFKIE